MKNKIVAMMMIGMLAVSMTACGGSETPTKNPSESTQNQEELKTEATYQSILDDYTTKIKEAVPKLLEEYNSESADKLNDINALAELSNSKIEKLAEISNEGIGKMADLMLKSGDSQETYEEWAGKLTDVYMTEAQQITDAYMNSASGMSTEDMMNSLESMMPAQ